MFPNPKTQNAIIVPMNRIPSDQELQALNKKLCRRLRRQGFSVPKDANLVEFVPTKKGGQKS